MTGHLSENQLQRAKAVPIAEVIAPHVKLQRRGPEFVGLCPFHSERSPSFTVIPARNFFHCHGCGANGDAIGFLMRLKGLDYPTAVLQLAGDDYKSAGRARVALPKAPDHGKERRAEIARDIWRAAAPIGGTPAEQYLRGRGLAGVTLPLTLRFHAGIWHGETRQTLPAMVGQVVRGGVAGIQGVPEFCAVHITYLGRDSTGRWIKARVEPDKRMLGPVRGGAVRLSSYVAGPLGLCEGIETGLSAIKLRSDLAVWATLSAGGLLGCDVPARISDIIILPDSDWPRLRPKRDGSGGESDWHAAGPDNAARKHDQLIARGHRVRLVHPDPGDDVDDWRARLDG